MRRLANEECKEAKQERTRPKGRPRRGVKRRCDRVRRAPKERKGRDEPEGKREEGKPWTVEEKCGKVRQAYQFHTHRERKSSAFELRRQ